MGWLADVIANTPIASTWGNTIRDRTLTWFTSAAERSSQVASATDGMASWLRDVHALEIYNGVAWRKPWNMPWGVVDYVTNTAGQSAINAETNLANLISAQTYVANRRLRITGYLPQATSSSSAVYWILRIKQDAAVVLQAAWQATPGAGNPAAVIAQVCLISTAGARTFNLTGETGTPGGSFAASAAAPAFLLIEDLGPAGVAA